MVVFVTGNYFLIQAAASSSATNPAANAWEPSETARSSRRRGNKVAAWSNTPQSNRTPTRIWRARYRMSLHLLIGMYRAYEVLICIAYKNCERIIRYWIEGLLAVSTTADDASYCITLDGGRRTETWDCVLKCFGGLLRGEAVGLAGVVDSIGFVEWSKLFLL